MDFSDITEDIPLRALAQASQLPIGTCVSLDVLKNEARYAETLAREFDMCVAENAFKPSFVWHGPDAFDFSETDRLASFARNHGMVLRGHTLVWHQSVPQWLRDGGYSPPQVRDLLRGYIHAMVGRYRGTIAMWDVVNEAVTDGDASDWRTDSFWYQTLGPDYVALAFHWAHEADPDVPLYYNDYETEGLTPKSDRVYRLAQELQAADVPLDGIGLQGHLVNGWRATEDDRTNIRRIAALGLDWQITECDIRMRLDGNAPTPAQLELQADGYRDLIDLCLTEARCRGFVLWGFTDKHSWIPGFRAGEGAALPLDADYRPKPAYHAIADRLREAAAHE